MSETVHYRGVATQINIPRDKSLVDVAEEILKERNIKIEEYYANSLEQLCSDYFFDARTESLYELDNNGYDDNDEIIRAEEKSETIVEYELKYYNGGAGFEECLAEAFNKLEM
jgi:hypothetical protein